MLVMSCVGQQMSARLEINPQYPCRRFCVILSRVEYSQSTSRLMCPVKFPDDVHSSPISFGMQKTDENIMIIVMITITNDNKLHRIF